VSRFTAPDATHFEDRNGPMELQVTVDARAALGKHVRQLRQAGIVPGVVFGRARESIAVQLDAKKAESLYRTAGRTSIVQLAVAGGDATSAIIKSIQRHPLTGRMLHVDFFIVDLTHEMEVEIPLVFTGEPPAIELTGGSLFTNLSSIKVRALPADLPREITVDVTPLADLDAAIHVRDLVVPAKAEILADGDELVAKVIPPRVEEEEPTVEAAEGEEGAEEGEEGAAEGGEEAEAGAGESPGSGES
jgi:large subunit ribosomal protein L25